MVGAGALRDELREQTPAMVDEITALASIDSGSYDAAGVDRVADGYAALFAARGCTIARRPLPERGHQLTARLEVGDGPTVLVVGHADTVWPAGTAAAWPVARDGDWLSGPGVGDMKGCVVMAAHAIDACRHGLTGWARRVLLVPDESHSLGAARGSRSVPGSPTPAWAWRRLARRRVVVARGAVGVVRRPRPHRPPRRARRGRQRGRGARAAGGALHDCRPTERARAVGVPVDGPAGRPDEAELHVDLRAPTAEGADALLQRIDMVLAAHARPGVRIETSGGFTRPSMEPVVSGALWELARARAAELGIPLQAEHTRGGSDASFPAALGVPTLDGLGPICHDSCARGERIEIPSLADRGAVFAGLLLDLAAQAR